MKKICTLIALLLAFTLGSHAANDTIPAAPAPEAAPTKAAADTAYIRGQYDEAARLYEALLVAGEASELYYNLGNSYYKSEHIGRAILNYERALLLNPGNADIRANLAIARTKTIDKETPQPEIFFVAWIKALVSSLGISAWSTLAIASFLLLLASLALYFISRRIALKKTGFITAVFCLVVTVISNLCAYQQHRRLTDRHDAIVVMPGVTVRSTPSESGTSLFILHEGRKVTVKDDTMRAWKEITLEDGKVGWIPAEAIEVI